MAVIGYLLIVALIKGMVLARALPINLDSSESFAFVVMVPLTATFTYSLAVFTFGLGGDLAARQSMYPSRLFSLPVTTAALSGLPMLYGSVVMMILWLATRMFALWPSGVPVPSLWPALMAASLLAWTQALTWMPYPLPGLRIIVCVLWLATIDTIAIVAVHFNAGESLMLAILAPQIPLAYVVARFAVARARRGDVPDWRGAFAWLAHVADFAARRRRQFTSPASAQVWFEWRRHGRSLPGWVVILLPFELVLFWAAGDSTSLVFTILAVVLLTPPFVATFAAAAVSDSGSSASGSYGMTPFIATRPMTDAQLVAAKLKMAIRSTIGAWLLILVTLPLALKLSGASVLLLDRWHRLRDIMGTPRAVVLLMLIAAACIAATWTQLVRTLYLGLTGRASLVKGSVILVLAFFFLFGPFAEWIIDSGRVGELWSALPWIFAVLVALKMIAVVWIAVRLHHGRLVSDGVLVGGAACWSIAVF